MTPPHFLSLGAGVQSSVMLLMAYEGTIEPMPEAAIFADTQWEPRAVYQHLDWLEEMVGDRIPIHRVTAGNIRADTMRGENSTGHKFITIPLFTADGGMGRRNCTYQYKLQPIKRKVRELLGYEEGQRVRHTGQVQAVSYIGISADEVQRMKPPRDMWWDNRWPLIEMNMTRRECRSWFEDRFPGRLLPRSACVACPYRSAREWREIRDDPEQWADAVEFDRAVRTADPDREFFVHAARIPLEEVDLRSAEEKGQVDLWANECEGMCGL